MGPMRERAAGAVAMAAVSHGEPVDLHPPGPGQPGGRTPAPTDSSELTA